MGNGTLGELDSNDFAAAGAFAVSAAAGARLAARGNRVAGSSRAAYSLAGAGTWARLDGESLDANGAHAVFATAGAAARLAGCRAAGHEHSVSAFDGGTRVWLDADNSLRDCRSGRPVVAAVGARVEWDGGQMEAPCVVVTEPGDLAVPAEDLVAPAL